MARTTVFLKDFEKKRIISEDYWYSYLEEGKKKIFRVYKNEIKIFEREANADDAYEVFISCGSNDKAFITPVTPPKRTWELVAWLLGFTKNERTSMYDEYVCMIEKKRAQYEKPGYVESSLAGPHFEFTEYSSIDDEDHKYYAMACWIDEDMSKKEVLHLLPEYDYPEHYLRKVLRERFNVSDEEFDKAYYEQ